MSTDSGRPFPPPVGNVDLGDFRRNRAFSRVWGFDRGCPVDRVYIERFLNRHASDVQGHVLEVDNDGYTRRFGGGRVTKADVVDIRPHNPQATLTADLTHAPQIPDGRYDCFILTQTLQLILDVDAAIETACRILKPGGTLLLTVPAITPASPSPEKEGDFMWAFFPAAVRRLLLRYFDPGNLLVESHGNLLTSVAFLAGLAQEDLDNAVFDTDDGQFPMIVCARAEKRVAG